MVDFDFKDFKPGVIYNIGKSEYIGGMPVRHEFSLMGKDQDPNFTDKELSEHGSLALRLFVHVDDPIEDNRVTSDYTLTVGGSVLVRAKSGGWYMTTLEKNRKGWFVRVGEKPNRHHLDVTLDTKRGCYVVRETV